jgi:hypothetical protein
VFVLEMGSHLIPGMHEWVMATIGMQASWYLQFVLTLLVLAIPGPPFLPEGLPGAAAAGAGHELAGGGGHRRGLRLLGGGDLPAPLLPAAR